jgi:hypothetical protein
MFCVKAEQVGRSCPFVEGEPPLAMNAGSLDKEASVGLPAPQRRGMGR